MVEHYDFFVSCAQGDEGWASWIAWQLEERRLLDGQQPRVFVRAWDVVAGSHEVATTNLALTSSERLIAVLSPRYLDASEQGEAEWAAFWSTDPGGHRRRVVPVRIQECQPNGLLGSIDYIDLVGQDAASAPDVLLSGIDASLSGRAKPPTAPAFPGTARDSEPGTTPQFPGPPVLVGQPPAVPPNWFQDRTSELQDLERHLGNADTTVVLVAGREGFGKTAMIHRLREQVGAGRSPLHVHGFVYLSAHAFAPVTAARVIDSLVQTLPKQEALQLKPTVRLPLPPVEKLVLVLDALAGREVVVAIDAVEDLLDRDAGLADPALRELVDYLLSVPRRELRLLLVGRRVPESLTERFPRSTYQRNLDEGLPEPEAIGLLRVMDADGRLGLHDVPEHDIGRLHRLTRGSPRALELAYGALDVPGRSFGWLLDFMERADGEDMVVRLLALALEQLSEQERRVVQALAVYGRPVPPRAVDFLLQDDTPSRPVLEKLRQRRLVRSDGDCFSIPPTAESDYLLGRTGPALPALLTRAADWFVDERHPEPQQTDDLRAQLSEIDLRLRAGAHEAAFTLLGCIDDRYLLGWGSSSAVVPPLQKLLRSEGLPRDLEIDAESMLARALIQQEDYGAAVGHLSRAFERASGARYARRRIVLHEQLAAAHLRLDELQVAISHSRKACVAAVLQARARDAMKATAGLALYRAREGHFAAALRDFAYARRLLRLYGTETDRVHLPTILIGEAWAYGQCGHGERARSRLHEARRRAAELGDRRLEGMCLHGEAELALDDGHLDQAVKLAEEAAAIGVRNGHRALCRVAMEILAQVRLCQDDLAGAERAAEIAQRSRCSVIGFTLVGLAAYRQRRDKQALAAFRKGCDEAERRRRPHERNFQLLDAHGLAASGLALLDDPSGMKTALAAFRAAREATTEVGPVRRTQLLLSQFGSRADPTILERVRAAAKGERIGVSG